MTSASVGIVTALQAEARVLTRQRPRAATPLPLATGVLWLGGMGPVAARKGAMALVRHGACALVSFGVAGGLAPEARPGMLACPARVVDEEARAYAAFAPWRDALLQRLVDTGLPVLADGDLLTVPFPMLSSADKAAMHARHGCVAVDMESAAIASVAKEQRVPFIVLRAIVDAQEDSVPAKLSDCIDSMGRPRARRLVGALMHDPRLLARLPMLALRMGKATHALRAAVAIAGTGLGHAMTKPC